MWLWQEKCDKSNGTFSFGSYKYKTNICELSNKPSKICKTVLQQWPTCLELSVSPVLGKLKSR